MNLARVERPPLPPPLDQHPLLVRHSAQRRRLQLAIAACIDEQACLTAQRQVCVDQQLTALASSPEAASMNARRLSGLNQELAAAVQRQRDLQRTLDEHDGQTSEVRAAARASTLQAVRTAARDRIDALSAVLDEVERLAGELEELRALRLISLPIVPTAIAKLVPRFRVEAAAFPEK